jgi:hypothetical protein
MWVVKEQARSFFLFLDQQRTKKAPSLLFLLLVFESSADLAKPTTT